MTPTAKMVLRVLNWLFTPFKERKGDRLVILIDDGHQWVQGYISVNQDEPS